MKNFPITIELHLLQTNSIITQPGDPVQVLLTEVASASSNYHTIKQLLQKQITYKEYNLSLCANNS
jgi:hypothetical protein